MFGRAQFQFDHSIQAQVGSSRGQRLKEGRFSPTSLSRASYPRLSQAAGSRKFALGLFAAAGDEAGEKRAAGGLADGVVAEVEADPHLFADVGQRRWQVRRCMKSTSPRFISAVTTRSRARSWSWIKWPTPLNKQWCNSPVAVAAGDDFDTAVLAEGISQRHPHGEHVGLVGLGQDHAVVLMPGGGTDGEAAMRPWWSLGIPGKYCSGGLMRMCWTGLE